MSAFDSLITTADPAATLLFSLPETLGSLGIPESIQRFLGRLHPMLVHFPVALLVMAGVAEFVRFRRKEALSGVAWFCLSFGALSALVAVFTGWLNADHESVSRSLKTELTYHRWTGISLAGIATLAWLLMGMHRVTGNVRLVLPCRALLLLAMLLTGAVGHLGGTLVYGDGYLTEVFEVPPERPEKVPSKGGEAAVPVDPAGSGAQGDGATDEAGGGEGGTNGDNGSEQPDETEPTTEPAAGPEDDAGGDPSAGAGQTPVGFYLAVIQPILEEHCYECHGRKKKKGNLRLNDMASVLERPEDEAVIVPGDPDNSLFFELLTLDEWDPDRMPEDADPLPPEQIEAIRKWIVDGAKYE